ncbi:MAG: long-chain-fatty-acyl-CoA reductase [Megasphaera sp.]|jgi:hypothetical protein|nr:long-chain-fatty-acyl-CoA reductase [Megasphaera sp.]MCI1823916.1 long-chain-fatty-acyl-CoA reductase [Megasphaera sp.]
MDNNIQILVGIIPEHAHPLPLFSPIVLDFLYALSHEIRQTPELYTNKDIAAFSFWLRRKHIYSFQKLTPTHPQRVGRGIIFHIAPTNIPIMFAYSLVISLLAGNNNIVRISPRIIPSMSPLITLIRKLWSKKDFQILKNSNALITYKRSSSITHYLSSICDGRIIWGGNDTINEIRKSQLSPQALDLAFADRYSLALFDAETIQQCNDEELKKWAHYFYNDTYDMDQNACSSPKLILWIDPSGKNIQQIQTRWWNEVYRAAINYELAPIKVSRKYTDLWTYSMTYPEIDYINQWNNLLYVYTLSTLPADITKLSGTFGQFFQFTLPSMLDCLPLFSKKIQTISTLGIDAPTLRTYMIQSGVLGGDRIVSIGEAMNMHIQWDGINILEYLSRLIG